MGLIYSQKKSFIIGFCGAILLVLLLNILLNNRTNNNPHALLLAANTTVSPTQVPTLSPTQEPTPTLSPTLKPTRKPTPKPTSTPKPTPVKITQSELEVLFEKAASHYAIEKQKLRNLAYCESRFNPSATNGIYGGLYQFSPSTWKSTRRAMNQDPNPTLRFNPEDAINTAAFKISTSGLSAWPYCSKQ